MATRALPGYNAAASRIQMPVPPPGRHLAVLHSYKDNERSGRFILNWLFPYVPGTGMKDGYDLNRVESQSIFLSRLSAIGVAHGPDGFDPAELAGRWAWVTLAVNRDGFLNVRRVEAPGDASWQPPKWEFPTDLEFV